MEWLADKLTNYIIKKNNIESESYEVYHYGMLTGLEMTLCMAICSIIAIHLKSFLEFIVLLVVFFSLRAYVGGVHFKNYFACLICSCSVITFLLTIARFWILDMRVTLIVTMVTIVLINWLAPVATKERVYDTDEAVFFNKQRKRVLLGIVILDIIFIIFEYNAFCSLIMYTMLVVLVSMIIGIYKNKWG